MAMMMTNSDGLAPVIGNRGIDPSRLTSVPGVMASANLSSVVIQTPVGMRQANYFDSDANVWSAGGGIGNSYSPGAGERTESGMWTAANGLSLLVPLCLLSTETVNS